MKKEERKRGKGCAACLFWEKEVRFFRFMGFGAQCVRVWGYYGEDAEDQSALPLLLSQGMLLM